VYFTISSNCLSRCAFQSQINIQNKSRLQTLNFSPSYPARDSLWMDHTSTDPLSLSPKPLPNSIHSGTRKLVCISLKF